MIRGQTMSDFLLLDENNVMSNSRTLAKGEHEPIDFSRRIKCVLGLVALCSVFCSLYGIACMADTSVCPPVFPVITNSTNATVDTNPTGPHHNTDAAGIGLVMLIIGVASIVPVLIVAALQYCINIGDIIGTDDNRMLSSGHTKRSIHIKQTAVAMLFASHFLSAWGDRMWQFAVPLLLMEMFIDNFTPTAIYALVVYSSCVQFMPSIGTWVDQKHRLYVQRKALLIDNASVLGTSVLLCLLVASTPSLGAYDQPPVLDLGFIVVFLGVLFLGVAGELMNQAQTLAIEKDWVVVIAEEIGSITSMNTWMRRIDLSCKVLAPWAVGAIISSVGDSRRMRIFYGAAAVGLWNAMAYPMELMLTTAVFYAFPALSEKPHVHENGTKHSHPNGHKDHSHFVHRHVLLSSNSEGSEVGSGGRRSGGGGGGSEGSEGSEGSGGSGGEKTVHVQHDTSSKELEQKNVHEGHWSDPHWHEQVGSIEHSHIDEHKGRINVDDASFTGNLVLGGEGNTFFQAFSNGFRLYVRHPVFLGK